MQFMTLQSKVDHVKHELEHFLSSEDQIKNSLFANETCTYAEIRSIMHKIKNQALLNNTLMPPNMLSQSMGFPMMQFPQMQLAPVQQEVQKGLSPSSAPFTSSISKSKDEAVLKDWNEVEDEEEEEVK